MIVIKGGRIIDPRSGLDGEGDLVIEGERIREIRIPGVPAADLSGAAERVIDAEGKIVAPGL
ncbi:MAG: dihydroorotase, partial [Treponema sp.]|nr:dihydroorotase [Treponema sp.]